MRQIFISPSILAADFGHLRDQVQQAEAAGAEYLHIDIMDGHFVPNITFGQGMVRALRQYSNALFDVHLLIENPARFLQDFAEAGADSLTFHLEAVDKPAELIHAIHALGKKAGISLHPNTPVSAVAPYLELVDSVMVMSVVPGFGGQPFMPSALDRIKELKRLIAGRPVLIEIDGGVNRSNIYEITKSGADIIVAGSAVFRSGDIATAIQNLRANFCLDEESWR
jgi:ribulose-phosphate 3-epimerase